MKRFEFVKPIKSAANLLETINQAMAQELVHRRDA